MSATSGSARHLPIRSLSFLASLSFTVYLIDPNGSYWSKLSLGWTQQQNGRYGIGPKAHFSYNHEGLADGARRFRTLPGIRQVIPILGMNVTPLPGVDSSRNPPITPEVRWSPQGVGLFTINEMTDFISSSITAGSQEARLL